MHYIKLVFIFIVTTKLLNIYADDNLNELNKPKCVLYGSCHMSVIYDYLKKNYPNLYNYSYLASHRVILNYDPFDKQIFNDADLLIFQPVSSNWGEMSTEFITNNILKHSCCLISFPALNFLGYFPDLYNAPNTPTPFLKLNECISKGLATDEIIEISKSDQFVLAEYVKERLTWSLNILKGYEQMTDIKISDYIEENYRKTRLFHTINHPVNLVLKVLLKRILTHMGLEADKVDGDSMFDKEVLGGVVHFIYPCIYNHLELEFPYNNEEYNKSIRYVLTNPVFDRGVRVNKMKK